MNKLHLTNHCYTGGTPGKHQAHERQTWKRILNNKSQIRDRDI
jgi:hypothetical protein